MVLAAVPEIVFAKKDGNLAKKTVFAIAQKNVLMTALARVSATVEFVLACLVTLSCPIVRAKNSVMKNVLEIRFVDVLESASVPKAFLGTIALKQLIVLLSMLVPRVYKMTNVFGVQRLTGAKTKTPCPIATFLTVLTIRCPLLL